MRIAVVGAGIAGLSCAHALERYLGAAGVPAGQVTLFEANDYFGGHANTVQLTLDTPEGAVSHGVDTGFLVYNERTYPYLIKLFAELEVETVATDMSFAVSLPHVGRHGLEWSGTDLDSVFAQRGNLFRPAFLRMLRDILRFNRMTTAMAEAGNADALAEPLGEFLTRHGFSAPFRDWYLLPMTGCIWSCSTAQMLAFPVGTLIRFCHNHGLLQVNNRPRWFTVKGGSRNYVRKIVSGLGDARLQAVRSVRRVTANNRVAFDIVTEAGPERFDLVVFACHSDQALALLGNPTEAERAVLSAVRYQPNRAILHSDARLLPKRQSVWSAWNYSARPADDATGEAANVCVHYLINKLQPLPVAWGDRPVVVSLNPIVAPDPALVHGSFDYAHPVFDMAAIAAQQRLPEIQGAEGAWFCGAWTGYGFHEDGLKSGREVALDIASALALDGSAEKAA
jgi:predicted NAD/FAD-binding protein